MRANNIFFNYAFIQSFSRNMSVFYACAGFFVVAHFAVCKKECPLISSGGFVYFYNDKPVNFTWSPIYFRNSDAGFFKQFVLIIRLIALFQPDAFSQPENRNGKIFLNFLKITVNPKI